MKNKGRFIAIIGLILGLAWLMVYSQKTKEQKTLKPEVEQALKGISIRDLHSHIGFLASDELEGRGTPSKVLDIAALYIGAEFEQYGLLPGGDKDSYMQPYDINIFPFAKENLRVSLSIADTERKVNDDEMIPLLGFIAGTSIDIKSDVVFAGYGITAPEKNWDDYGNLDVRGKVVLVMEGAPWDLDLDVPFGYDKLLFKWINAGQHGAVGFIYATPFFGGQEPLSVSFLKGLTSEFILMRKSLEPQIIWCIPGIVTSFTVADEIIKSANKGDLNSIVEKISEQKKPFCFHVEQTQFVLKLEAEPEEEKTFNVVGIVKGSDPKLAEEYIVVTAHYDHVGIGLPVNGDSICNGADDNASGTAGVMELAQAFASLSEKMRPRRSMLFLLVSGEERGLFGSAHYAENPTIPLNQIKANVNLDMIGRCPKSGVEVIAPGSEALAEMFMKNAQSVGLITRPDQHSEMRLLFLSDQFPFVYNDIPAVFCFTGLHADYHQPSDHIEKLNFKDMEKIVKAAFLTTFELANLDTIPAFTPPAYFIQQ